MYSLKREKGKKAMNLTYQSTRGGESGLTASQAILKGLADDGGLFMPKMWKLAKRRLQHAGKRWKRLLQPTKRLWPHAGMNWLRLLLLTKPLWQPVSAP